MSEFLHRLVWKISNRNDLDDDDRAFLINLVKGQIKRPAHRPRGSAEGRRAIAMTVLSYESEHQCGRESAVAQAMSVHKVSRKHVFDAINELRNLPIRTEMWNVAGVTTRFVCGADGKWSKLD